jgi:hypothetical protein
MNDALSSMMSRYQPRGLDDSLQALREIVQEIALLGLWRAKFFDKAAFYGGSALRILHGLDRFSEDLDFSLLHRRADFDLSGSLAALEREVESFGFSFKAEIVQKRVATPIQSAFLKGDTQKQLLVIRAGEEILKLVPRGKTVKINLEVDTDPPGGFATEMRYLLQPLPFAVRVFSLPDLFAGKMHAVLCRRWKSRVKGRDWYDLVWYVGRYPELRLSHLEQRMRQTGDWAGNDPLSADTFRSLLNAAIEKFDVEQAKREVMPFVRRPEALSVWSKAFFRDVAGRITLLRS